MTILRLWSKSAGRRPPAARRFRVAACVGGGDSPAIRDPLAAYRFFSDPFRLPRIPSPEPRIPSFWHCSCACPGLTRLPLDPRPGRSSH